MLDNNKCILAYGLSREELRLLTELNYKIIRLTPEMHQMTINDILNGLVFETVNLNVIREKVIIYNNFSERELKSIIAQTRSRIEGGILAVITPNSINWTLDYLIRHLIEERQWHLRNRKE